ncbi:hypothetical protein MMC10_008597 [Thelotrema lepadinum]|nr:hypothetical protein [Thelotrema lepadinum]
MAAVQILPTELLEMIILPLSQQDLKSLRVTCRVLALNTTASVFRRVAISFLKIDRANFFHICDSPHLRPFVQELVWYESDLNQPGLGAFARDIREYDPDPSWSPTEENPFRGLDQSPFTMISKSRLAHWESLWWMLKPGSDARLKRTNRIETSEDREERRREFMDLGHASELPWDALRKRTNRTEALEGLEEGRREFLAVFGPALGRLSNLRTVVSRPMPQHRLIPIFNSASTAVQQIPRRGHAINYGLLFLLDATNTLDLDIQNLFWADRTALSSAHRLLLPAAQAFRKLRLINLCLKTPSSQGKPPSITNLAHCLQSSVQLCDLSICYERASGQPSVNLRKGLERFKYLLARSHWPFLERLRLINFSFYGEKMLAFLEKHAESLRHLDLEECAVYVPSSRPFISNPIPAGWKSLIEGMRSINGLDLKSLQITQGGDPIPVEEEDVLQFINEGVGNVLHHCQKNHLIGTDSKWDDSPLRDFELRNVGSDPDPWNEF